MKSFIAGLAIGAGLGIALAPEQGKSTRSKLRRKVEEVAKELSPEQPHRSENSEEGVQQSRLADRDNEVQTFQTSEQAGPAQDEVAGVLNTASKSELMSVDGIGKATAKRIIKNRPYQSADDAVENEVLPETTLENLKEQLINDKEVA